MIQKLTIKNYALIEEMEMEFSSGFTVITGETGAGKSILLGALGLILGNRADSSTLGNVQEKCIVEGCFEIGYLNLQPFFEANDLDYDDNTIIRREILPTTKSRAFVNDVPVTVQVLKELGELLIDINAQHQNTQLGKPDFQLQLIDSLADNKTLISQYLTASKAYVAAKKNHDELLKSAQAQGQELDFIQYQFNELEAMQLTTASEQEILEEESRKLSHAGEIKLLLADLLAMLQEGDAPLIDQLNLFKHKLDNLIKLDKSVSNWLGPIHALLLEVKDLNREINNYAEHAEITPGRLEEIDSRLSDLYRLQKKHQVQDIQGLIELRNTLGNKLHVINNYDQEIEKAHKYLLTCQETLQLAANTLSKSRSLVVEGFEKQVNAELAQLSMSYSRINVNIEQQQNFQHNYRGLDSVQFLFTSNKGVPPLEIQRVASGGELSRLLLSIKAVVATKVHQPTVVFDEIDTGISGEVAFKVGNAMQRIAVKHQVIAITHLPSIASKGQKHYFVYKDHTSAVSATKIRALQGNERSIEIAKMIAGENFTDAALNSANELLNLN